jgi:hypothetical protein
MEGVAMILHHPEVPTCKDCQEWMYDKEWKKTLRLQIGPDGELARLPLRRRKGDPTPCPTCPKSHDGQPHPEKELSRKNAAAWRHYMECKATGQFPDDAIVRHNAALIRWIEESADRSNQRMIPSLLIAALASKKK